MPYYSYHAIDQAGNEKHGTLSAKDKNAAIGKLKAKHLYPTKIYQVEKNYTPNRPEAVAPKSAFSFLRRFKSRVSHKDRIGFIRDLSVLIEAGLPIIRALRILREQTGSPAMSRIISGLEVSVENGQTFSESMRQYPAVFPELFINMIRAGELGGGQLLAEVLKRLASLCESSERLNERIKAALTYPIVVLAFALIIVLLLVTFILPKFLVIYAEMELALPFVTQLLFDIVGTMRTRWYLIPVVLVLIVAFFSFLKQSKRCAALWDGYKLRLPVLGDLFLKVAISRFSRTLGTLLNSGVPILQALSIVRDATGNLKMAKSIDKAHSSIREGESIAGPLTASGIFPPLVTNMIMVGEESGNVVQILLKISDKYDEDVELTVMRLTSLLEPFLILILGIIVVFVIVALFMPLVTLMQGLSA